MNPNGIKKNDYILVTRDNGKVILGRATKVAPWSKNPKVTVVNYHFKDGEAMYAAKADARKCRMAPADMIPEAAPIHPIMKDWDVGPMRKGPMMMEGYYFSSTISFFGKKVGKIVDRGDGGMVDLEFKDFATQRKFEEDAKKWASANGGDENDGYEEFWTWMTDHRHRGIPADTYFKEKKEEFAKWTAKA